MINDSFNRSKEYNISKEIEDKIRNTVLTSMPAVITDASEYESLQVVSVQPLIAQMDWTYTALEPPEIYKVPVRLPAGGGGVLSFPVKKGDTVALCFTHTNLEDWLFSNGSMLIPKFPTSFRFSDAYVDLGLFTTTSHLNPNPNDVELKFNGLSFRLEKESGDFVLENAIGDCRFQPDGTFLHYSGARITPSGDFVTASGVSLDNHYHTQGVDSDGNSQANTEAPTATE